MSWIGGAIAGGLGLLGSVMGADAASEAASTSANAQLQAAKLAADAQKFRPVGITTNFGTSQFTLDPKTGYLTNAGYTLSPQLQAIQNNLMSQAGAQGTGFAGQGLTAAQGLFNLGNQYLAQSPEQAAQQWMASQQAALAPGRERAYNQVQQGLFNRGRSGLAVGQGTGMQAANPEMAAYYNALAQQDLDLAARAQEQGRAQTTFGAGLFGTGAQLANAGYAPLQTQLGLAQTIEQLGQSPLAIGSELGGRAATYGANVGNTLLQGGLNAARTLQAGTGYSPIGDTLSGLAGNQQLISGINKLFGSTPSYYNPVTQTGGFAGSSLANFFYGGNTGSGD